MFLGRRGNSRAGSIPVVRTIENEKGIIFLDLKVFLINPDSIKA